MITTLPVDGFTFNSLSRDHVGYEGEQVGLEVRLTFNSLSRDHRVPRSRPVAALENTFNSLSRDHWLGTKVEGMDGDFSFNSLSRDHFMLTSR